MPQSYCVMYILFSPTAYYILNLLAYIVPCCIFVLHMHYHQRRHIGTKILPPSPSLKGATSPCSPVLF